MNRRPRRILMGISAGLIFLVSGFQLSRWFFEKPNYEVLLRKDNVELRAYEPRLVAETVVQREDRELATNEGFQRLADFIFGANTTGGAKNASIAMTSPVEAAPTSNSRIAMTTPVEATSPASGSWTVTFTMPSKYTLETVPVPEDSRVTLRQREGETVAALRFSGRIDEADRSLREAELLRAVQEAGYVPLGPVTVAIYDPPSVVLSIFRRNELIVPVQRSKPREQAG